MEQQVDTRASEVTVYPDRARVTRTGSCEVTADTRRLIVDDLPVALDPASLRVNGRGTARVTILGVDAVRSHHQESAVDQVRELERQLESADDELRVLHDQRAVLAAEAGYLAGLRAETREYARALAWGKATVDSQEQLARFLRERDADVRQQQHGIEQQQRVVERRVAQLRATLEQLRSAHPRASVRARIEIAVTAVGRLDLTLSYVVHNARWQPLYDVRLATSERGQILDVTFLAQITQQTGEDWNAVAVQVSTARPALSQRPPELQPWYIEIASGGAVLRQAQRRTSLLSPGAPSAAAPAMMAADETAVAAVEHDAEVAVATVAQGDLAVSFAITGSVDLPTDGTAHKVTVAHFALTPRLDYFSIPKHAAAVYRRVKVVNDSPSPLLEGQASLFVGDEYIGTTGLAFTPRGAELELSLGVEERVNLKRQLRKRDVDKRLLRDQRSIHYAYQIEVENLLDTVAAVEIRDHVPVARHESIKIELDRAKPAPTVHTDLNLLEWRLQVPATTTAVIEYEFTVGHPSRDRIAGLD